MLFLSTTTCNTAAVSGESDEDIAPSLKATWKAKKGDPSNGGYSQELLEDLFSEVSDPWKNLYFCSSVVLCAVWRGSCACVQ